jgi:hypothetical protein
LIDIYFNGDGGCFNTEYGSSIDFGQHGPCF